jgi:hypothetical protein
MKNQQPEKPLRILFRADGTHQIFETNQGFKGMRALIGADTAELVSYIPGTPGYELLCDEDGIGKGLPINGHASAIAGQPMVGDVFLYPKGDVT